MTPAPADIPYTPSSAPASRGAEARRAVLACALGPHAIDSSTVRAVSDALGRDPMTREQAEHVLSGWKRRGMVESAGFGLYRFTHAGRTHYRIEAAAGPAPVPLALGEQRLGRKGDGFRRRPARPRSPGARTSDPAEPR